MHICIVGGGAAGLMAAHALKKIEDVNQITILKTSEIRTIGVGESTTLSFVEWINDYLELGPQSYQEFIKDIAASVKYGVFYEGWSKKDYLHGFYSAKDDILYNMYLLGNKPKEINVNEFNSYIASFAKTNKVVLDNYNFPFSLQFEADKFVLKLTSMANNEPKITVNESKIKKVNYKDDFITSLILENGKELKADFFINAMGSSSEKQDLFKNEYESFEDILLTNKAIIAPLEYNNKKEEMKPYTTAKTMKYGWRWITPTNTRIGTGYVFSDKYCSIEEAKKELAEDIGYSIDFEVVDFKPRKVKETFHKNWCNLGMANGFLEPLDAPGLALTMSNIKQIIDIINRYDWYQENPVNLEVVNKEADFNFNFWASFILLQYKTSNREDTNFWIDQKNISFEFFSKLYLEISSLKTNWEKGMFWNTIAGKDIQWKTHVNKEPKKLNYNHLESMDHFDFIEKIHNEKDFFYSLLHLTK